MTIENKSLGFLRSIIFLSRWLQAPLYFGLIIALGVYVYHFGYGISHLFHTSAGAKQCIDVPGRADQIDHLHDRIKSLEKELNKTRSAKTADTSGNQNVEKIKSKSLASSCPRPDEQVEISAETHVMLVVLDLIDVVMIANLLIMVIIGGYETFVSRLHLRTHPDKPEWLSQVNASVLKVKLAMALIGISSIHLLRTFILVPHYSSDTIFWHIMIHLAFLISAIAMAMTDRIMHPPHNANHNTAG